MTERCPMIVLMFFSFLAGIVTVLSPCVLPILPALLSASTAQGRYRPIGIVLGLILSFSFFTLTLTAIIHATHLPPDILRYVAIAIIAFFGLVMIFPSLGELFAEKTAGIAAIGQSVQEKSGHISSGFGSGFVLGMALGIVWTPCAGPILAAITTLAATSAITWHAVVLTVVYSLGSAIPMFLIIYGGSKSFSSVKVFSQHTGTIRKSFGALMILTALAIAFHIDVKFQEFAIQYFPLMNIEDNAIVRKELEKLRPTSEFATALQKGQEDVPEEHNAVATLPMLAPAPDFVGIDYWINSEPLTIQELKGKVVLVDFWTYSCINCIRTLPYLTRWYRDYHDKGLVIVGIHTPEFPFEKVLSNVQDAVKRFNIPYPVGLDNEFKTWENYSNRFWPAHYLIDQEGVVRSFHIGEGKYVETENQIRKLLGMEPVDLKEPVVNARALTAETYLGTDRGDHYVKGFTPVMNQPQMYDYTPPLPDDKVGLKGKWTVRDMKITSNSSTSFLDLNFIGSQVYLVMDSRTPELATVFLDGAPLPKEYYTADMDQRGRLMIKEARKYDIINLKGNYGRHQLSIQLPNGVSAYAFTFGDE